MIRLVVKRLLALIPVMLGISFLAFMSLALCPGDAAKISLIALEGSETPPQNAVEAMRVEMGLDQPLAQQYLLWLGRVSRGDLGYSYQTRRPVVDELARAFPATAILATTSMLVSLLLVVPVGVFAAIRKNRTWDHLTLSGSLLLSAVPDFFLGLVLILLFSVHWHLVPVAGFGDLKNLIIPTITLALTNAAVSTRLMRTSMLEVLGEKFLPAIRAKGVAESLVIIRHALRGAIIPVLSYMGTQFGFLFGGAAVVESVFLWPGLGRLLVEAVRSRDIFVVQGAVLAIAGSYVFINLLVDLLQAVLDPRVRHAQQEY